MKAVNLLPNDQRGAAKASSAAATPSKAPTGDGGGAYVVLGALALAVSNPTVLRLFEITGLDDTFEILPTREEALKRVRDERPREG